MCFLYTRLQKKKHLLTSSAVFNCDIYFFQKQTIDCLNHTLITEKLSLQITTHILIFIQQFINNFPMCINAE